MKKSLTGFASIAQAVNRRRILKGAGGVLGAGAALAVASVPARAEDSNSIAGLWGVTVSSPGSPPFPAFENWGDDGTWTGSGQPDLTPAALGSTAWGQWKKVGERNYRVIARFWTYTPTAVPSGYAAIDFTYTLSKDGKKYAGVGVTTFYDTNNNLLFSAQTYDDGVRIA